jgi:signal transduction histidine kinase
VGETQVTEALALAAPKRDSQVNSILILDDRSVDRELLATLLGHAGYRVREASTGEEALELARAERPDLVITDVLMPGMNGYEFVARLRSHPDTESIPVVFCTAHHVEDAVRQLATACGVAYFIPKPSDPDTVVGTVGAALGPARVLPESALDEDFDADDLRKLNERLIDQVTRLDAANVERRKLLGQLVHAHEEDQERIAAGLHDDSIQAVVALRMRLETLVPSVRDPDLARELEALRADAGEAVERLRNLLFEVQPVDLEQNRVLVALRVFLEQDGAEGLEHTVEDRTTRRPCLSIRSLLYRVGREAIANVRQHANASTIGVLLYDDGGGFCLEVTDDGDGFDAERGLRVRPGHLGLAELRERVEIVGGRLHVQSEAGAGTSLRVWLPDFDPTGALPSPLSS